MRIKALSCFLIILIFTNSLYEYAFCSNIIINGERYSNAEEAELLNNLQVKKIFKETIDSYIKDYDISNEGNVEVLMDNQTINIYDKDGTYLYGYSFICNEWCNSYWENNNLVIFFDRGGIKLLISQDDFSLYKVQPRDIPRFESNNIKTYKQLEYTLSTKHKQLNPFSTKRDILKCKDAKGNEKIILDVSNENNNKINFRYIIWGIFILGNIIQFSIIRILKNKKKSYTKSRRVIR